MTELSSDWWMSEATALRAPKQEIGDYVESQGFDVPRRFGTLDEALDVVRADGGIVIRSEHREEYDGPSGLLQTYVIDERSADDSTRVFEQYGNFDIDEEVYASQNRCAVTAWRQGDGPGYRTMADVVLGVALNTPTDLTIQRLMQLTSQEYMVRRYAHLTDREVPELMQEAQFSFWEHIPGSNVTVIADSAIDDRYHVLANSPKRKNMPSYCGWQIADERGNSMIGTENDNVLTPEATENLIKTYEAIRNLPRFASEHCPIMELQLDEKGQIWFLQYHRARDFQAAGAPLNPDDFSAKEGWQKVDGVRGAIDTPSTLKTALWYPDHYGSRRRVARQLPEVEEGSADWHYDWSLSEILSRRRLGYIAQDSYARHYDTMAAAHAARSKWFKPLVAVACNDRGLENLIPKMVKKEILNTVYREGDFSQVVIDLAADGNTGYVRLNPDSEQPYYEAY